MTGRCPTPHKTRFRDRISALTALTSIRRRSDRDTVPVRAYHCPCGAWHLTSADDPPD